MSENRAIKFKYIFDNNYNPKYANGAYGGVSPKGEITINFYCERQAIPKSVKHDVIDGKLSESTETEPEDLQSSMVRFVDTGVILNINTAKEIVTWLNEKIELVEKSMLHNNDKTEH